MPPLCVTASLSSIDRVHTVDGSVTIFQGSYESQGDLKPIYLICLELGWKGRNVKITSWADDATDFSEACVKAAWDEAIRGMAYQSGSGITRYLKEEVLRKEHLDIQVPIIAENLFTSVLNELTVKMTALYPETPRREVVDPIEAEFVTEQRPADA